MIAFQILTNAMKRLEFVANTVKIHLVVSCVNVWMDIGNRKTGGRAKRKMVLFLLFCKMVYSEQNNYVIYYLKC